MRTLISKLTVVLVATVPSGRADVLELKNGTTLNGKYLGGTGTTVRLETSAGVQTIDTAQIIALTFTTAGAAAAPAAAAPAPRPTSTVTLPAGTTLLVRTMDSVSSKNKAGTPFTTKLETDLGGIRA